MSQLLKRHKSICKMLETKTAEEVAGAFGVSKGKMQKFIERNGISITKIRRDIDKMLLLRMDGKFSIKQMVNKTGFSRRKVFRLLKEFGYKSKYKPGKKGTIK
jgi:hypothetical protein